MRTLQPEELFSACDAAGLGFGRSDELGPYDEILGQDRALQALHFGIGIPHAGFNLYALGPSESGRHSLTLELIRQRARQEAVPEEWVYVNNFQEANKPYAIRLPPGNAVRLREDMKQLVEELRSAVPAAFESDEYRARRQEIEDAFKEQQAKAFEAISQEAEGHNVALLRTPTGFVFAPTREGQVIEAEAYEKLSDKEREQIEQVMAALQEKLERVLVQFPRWRKEMNQQIKQLNHAMVLGAVGQLITELKKKYESVQPDLVDYFDAVQDDVLENAQMFRGGEEIGALVPGLSAQEPEKIPALLSRYNVNVIVDHSESEGAPVVQESNPSYINLVGRIEHLAHMGALVTDFNLIKSGALHRANGGYLVLDARKVLMQPYAWEGLKQALQTNAIKIESLGQALSLISTVSLEPEAIPLKVKVVLVGDRLLYYLLCRHDPDFERLFRVPADFDDRMARSPEQEREYAHMLASLVQREKLRPLQAEAMARVIEHGAREADDAERLSTRFGRILTLLQEADYQASLQQQEHITRVHVQKAIDDAWYRNCRIHERILEEIHRGTILIDTDGAKTGQVNGLSVMSLGDYGFGHPTRISVRVHPGKGQVVDIEREVKLGGPIHSKGVMILAGFLSGRFASHHPLSLAASVVFEQSYGGVEGDSASSAELYALLSALADVPLRQELAVTGSVNQLGEIQAIGGVNEKIEGFFAVCKARGLNGRQGVVIPESNVKHLMLRQEVVDAVQAGQFSVHAVRSVDEGIELLTGVSAGEPDARGEYPAGSINRKVMDRLTEMYRTLRHKEGDRNDS